MYDFYGEVSFPSPIAYDRSIPMIEVRLFAVLRHGRQKFYYRPETEVKDEAIVSLFPTVGGG